MENARPAAPVEPLVLRSSRCTATLYLADCRDILPVAVDAIVSDPPYGIDFEYNSHDDNEHDWKELMATVVPQMKASARCVIIPSCAINRMKWWYDTMPPDWLIAWHKGSPGHNSRIGFNDWEPHLVWGRPAKPMHDYFSTKCGHDDNGHPCPKPVKWARWLVARACGENETVCDPFMGSGTTGVACIHEGRNFIGVEKDAKYFEIAVERIRRELAQGRMF